MKIVFENRKITLGAMTLALIFAIVVVSSFWPFILDPTRISTDEFITDQLLNGAITISTTVAMMFISQAANAQNEKSEIARAKVEFRTSIARIKDRTPFYQWVRKVLQPGDREDMARKGMERLDVPWPVYSLCEAEIRALTVAQKYGETFYKPLTKRQIEGVLALKRQVNGTRFVSPNYYTSWKSWMAGKNLSQIAAKEGAKKASTVVFQLALKMTMTFIGSAILVSLVRDLTQEGGNTAQAWMRFLSRMFAFVTSAFLGYFTGCKLNDLDAFYIEKRVEVHTLYIEDKGFVPEDEAKLAFIERVAKEQVLPPPEGDGDGRR